MGEEAYGKLLEARSNGKDGMVIPEKLPKLITISHINTAQLDHGS